MRYLKFVYNIIYIYGIKENLKPVDMLLILLELPDLKHKNLRLFAKEIDAELRPTYTDPIQIPTGPITRT